MTVSRYLLVAILEAELAVVVPKKLKELGSPPESVIGECPKGMLSFEC